MGLERVWVCDLCGQRLEGAGARCNSGIHQGPDDPNGRRGKAVEYVRADLHAGAVSVAREMRAYAFTHAKFGDSGLADDLVAWADILDPPSGGQ